MKKDFIKIIVFVVVISILYSCSFIEKLPKVSKINEMQKVVKKSGYKYLDEIGSKIIQCLKERNKNNLNDLFCDKIRNSDYLFNEIGIVFDYIDKNGGIIIENENWSSPFGHGSNNYEGKTIEFYYGECDNITIGNKKYKLCIRTYQILKKHKEYEGINNLYFLENVSQDIRKQSIENKTIDNKSNNKSYLGFTLFNKNLETLEWENIIPKEVEENDLYEIPSNLEDDR